MRRADRSRRLSFEPLEDRRVLATFTVTNLNDATVSGPGSAPGTLRQAIYDANASPDADVINFAPGLSGDLRLSIAADSAIGLSALLVTSPITIQGSTDEIAIRRDVNAPVMRFFRVGLGGDLSLVSLSLIGGFTKGVDGSPGQNGGSAYAGAIYNQGNLQIISSTLSANSSLGGNAGSGADSGFAQGGAIFNDGGNVTIRSSTLSGNSVSNGTGPLVARSFGGGVYSKNGSLNIYNSTITNGAANSGRLLYIFGVGSGQVATVRIFSSIIAQSDIRANEFDLNATDDLGGQVNVTGANNIIRRHNVPHSMVFSTDDPLLAPLANNGGPTRTHSLLTDSPAIGHGSNPLGFTSDQRGGDFSRIVGGTIDIGALELQTVATPTLFGDYDGNRSVDAGDFVVWRKTAGTAMAPYAGADGSGNSLVDDADHGIWRANFGAMSSPAAAAAVSIEPTANLARSLNDDVAASTLATSIKFPSLDFRGSARKLSSKLQPSADATRHSHDAAILAIWADERGQQPKATVASFSDEEIASAITDWPPADVPLPLHQITNLRTLRSSEEKNI